MMSLRDRALLVKLFYQRVENAQADFREYRQLKHLRRELMTITNLRRIVDPDLWGYLKNIVYQRNVPDIPTLKDQITLHVRRIYADMMQATVVNVLYRKQLLEHQVGGRHEPNFGVETDNVQQYVEIGANTYLGTKDGMKYALIPTSDNKFKLCELPCESSISLNSAKSEWYTSPADENKTETSVTPTSGCRAIKLVAVRKEPTPCKGQGDESGNSIISTPDSASRFKNIDESTCGKILDSLDGNQIHLEESPPLTYTTLVPKQERIEDVTSVSYALPQNSFFQIPQAQLTPISSKPTRFVKPRQRAQLLRGNPPYPSCSPIPRATRGHRQRKPRQVWYQYRTPVLHSTPTSMSSASSSFSSGEITRNSSITGSEESQVSLEYPRVPNNTPNSKEENSESKQKMLDLQQWIPQIESSIESYVQMDPRESHNEKERKRRLRIKNACQMMKSLLPCVCDKTDNATVFENAVHFIAFMKETVGSDYDMEFLEQTCIY